MYEALPRDMITWGRWSDSIRKSHLDQKGGYRRLHAKIYRSLGDAPWSFVGSVNLSFKAFRQNIEAGFLIWGNAAKALLAPLEVPPDHFKIESEAHNQSDPCGHEMPPIQALFDWQDETLQFHLSGKQSGWLTLLNSASEVLLCVQLEAEASNEPPVPASQLKTHLQGSSLMHARWQSDSGNASGVVLISQRNTFCRPTCLPPLDLQALLRIFIGIQESRRLEVFGDLAVRLLQTSQDEGLQDEFLPTLTSEGVSESFFAEFSQVNGAFWGLAERLEKADLAGDSQTLAYYLKGHQPDSLRKLLEAIAAVDTKTNKPTSTLIVRYLTLLSAADLLKRFIKHADASLLHDTEKALVDLEQDELLKALDGANGEQFLRWFKAKFFEPVAVMTRARKEGECFEAN